MKKISFFALAIAGMLFTGCSDNDLATGPGQEEGLSEGYMSLNINLPTAPSSSMLRAANDDFADGENYEYNVKDCAVLLFQGDNESGATLFSVQTVVQPDGTSSAGDVHNVTTTYKPVLKIKGYDTTKNLYALAVLNYKNVLTIDVENDQAKIGTKNITSLSDIRTAETDANLTTRNGSQDYFFMTNAVLSEAQGGDVTTAPVSDKIFQLAQLCKDGANIYETEAEAIANPAGEIFVERAVAKATLKLSQTLENNKVVGTGDNALAISEVTWTIDNTEPTTYVARNPGDLSYIGYKSGGRDNYRFVGGLSTKYLKTGGTDGTNANVDNDYYRTYWCVDPQYTGERTTEMIGATDGVKTAANGTAALYCHENTFDVANQTYKNTTRAIIKVQLSETAEFYTINGGDKDSKENAEAAIEDYIFNKNAVLKAFKDQLNKNKSYEVTTSSLTIAYARNTETGQYEISELKVAGTLDEGDDKTFKTGAAATINTALSSAKEEINNEIIVRVYTGGVMYYVARFKHFAGENATDQNDLAPWKSGESWETAPTTSDAYHVTADATKAAQNYLGRYGMVRNNWYEVEITGFNKLGYPADPSGKVDNPFFDEPDTTDDSFEEVISTKIHVLSWAKRTQSWGF